MSAPIAAEPIFHIGAFAITNAYINSTIAVLILIAIAYFIKRSIKDVPGRFQSAIESIFEALLGYFDQVTNDRAKSKRFLPFVGTVFIFILLSNWMGLLPGTGSIGVWEIVHGQRELIPLLRPANSDLNLTLAMALVSVITSNILGIFTLGFFVHANKFIQLGTFWKALKTMNVMKILTATIELGVGVIEIISEIAKVVSLSLRLFGNIFAGEILITVIASLAAFFVPLPFMALELIVGMVQATVFALLTLVYLTVATAAPHGDEEHEKVEAVAAAH
ncbi:F0F1 ATP synthase subunit A [Patescibacteria group bacterium]|nr:F0F1 ATP synthase subunit A [Patescibacteria group bacterium]